MMRGLMAIASSLAEITKSLAGKNKSKRISGLYGAPCSRHVDSLVRIARRLPLAIRCVICAESSLHPKADRCSATTDVRFGPNADIALFNETPALQPSLGTVLCAHSSTQNAE